MNKSKVLAAAAMGFALAACSTGTPSSAPTSTSGSASASAMSSPTAGTPTTTATSTAATPTGPATSVSPTGSSSNSTENALSAVKTAETSANGKAIELDWDVNRWEATVLNGKTKRELDVSADGQTVLRRQTEVAEADDYRRLQSVKHDMTDAIKTATATVPGDIAEVDLETRRGVVVWELSIEKTGGGFAHVYVDVVNGSTVG